MYLVPKLQLGNAYYKTTTSTPSKTTYIHDNPVKRGYVDLSEHWRYSSYRNYFDTGLEVVFDGREVQDGNPLATVDSVFGFYVISYKRLVVLK
jgi:hypothetical protein